MFKVGFEGEGALSGCNVTSDPELEGLGVTGSAPDLARKEELHSLLACLGIMNATGAFVFSGDGSVLMAFLKTL